MQQERTPGEYRMTLFRHLSIVVATAFVGMCLPRVGVAQGIEQIKANYTKYEFRIPMRDGKRLFTAVYVPKDNSKTYPILLKRTPYSAKPYGVDQYPGNLGPSPLFSKEGYIFVYQDVRGRWMSEGEFVHMRPHRPNKQSKKEFDESTDTWDTVDWLVKNVRGNNGRVGIAGISYPGFYTAAGIIDSHPAIKAASPQAPVNDWFAGDDWHHNGAFFLAHMFNWMSRSGRVRPEPTKKFRFTFDYETPDGFEFFRRIKTLQEIDTKYLKGEVPFWHETLKHGTYDDFWKSRNIRPHLKNVKPAVMTVGGWFDAENLFGALETYKSIERNNPETFNMLVMGPWRHGGWSRGDGASFGDIPFNAKTSEFYREKIEFPFFQRHLKGKGEDKTQHPEAWVFETGTNQWRQYDKWPPQKAKSRSLHFHADQRLSFDAPKATDKQHNFDEYLSDPNKPVPYMNKISTGMTAEYMIADQRFASRRPDVLVYQTGELAEDVTIAGPVEVDLFVSTSGTGSDWVVKLIDVYPDDYPDAKENPKGVRMGGYQQLVRGDVIRGKFRNSLEQPEPFEPNKPTRVRFTMPDTYHSFRSGHRIMVQVQSSWFPLVDRNPQKFIDIYHAKPSDFQQATQRIFRSTAMPSKIN
ncbi:MAG: CocE/NonD family hydrolase, partial [Planctomycetaceae bacterium]|nr:CocE/NonD family hydrolase [Planctomycetaceae bacterium]